jgi:hypothetical protein
LEISRRLRHLARPNRQNSLSCINSRAQYVTFGAAEITGLPMENHGRRVCTIRLDALVFYAAELQTSLPESSAVYNPSHFALTDPPRIFQLIAEQPLALLAGAEPAGDPFAAHVPTAVRGGAGHRASAGAVDGVAGYQPRRCTAASAGLIAARG